jgi:hypothetical protein
MLTFTGLRNLYGTYTNNTTSANLTNGDGFINQAIRIILGNRDWPFLENTDTTQTTVASQQFYQLPYDYGKMIDVTVTVGNILYRPVEVSNRKDWDRLNFAQNVSSNIPLYYFIYNNQCGFWPNVSTGGNQITYNYKRIMKDLSLADYSTGGIYTATNGTTTIAGTSTVWAVSMAGRYLRITESDTANKGDGFWYQISSAAGTNTITLVKTYQGTSITTGNAAYTIGQVPLLPEQYQLLPVYWAAMEYWRGNGNNLEKSNEFKAMYGEMLAQFEEDYGSKSTDPMIDNGVWPREQTNPNLTLTL